MIVLGRPIRDMLPTLPSKLQIPKDQHRQTAMEKRSSEAHHRWNAHSKGLPPLKRGDSVHVQNQHGNHPGKWDSTGIITEVLQFHQYTVQMDGNGRLTTRNHRHLRRNLNPRPSPEQSLRARLETAAPRRPTTIARDPSPPTSPNRSNNTPNPPAVETQPTPAAPTPVGPQKPLPSPPQMPPAATPMEPPPAYNQALRKLQLPPTANLAGPRTYASIAGTPPISRPPPPKPPTSPTPNQATPSHVKPSQDKHRQEPKKATEQPPLRRSSRTRNPPDRLCQ